MSSRSASAQQCMLRGWSGSACRQYVGIVLNALSCIQEITGLYLPLRSASAMSAAKRGNNLADSP